MQLWQTFQQFLAQSPDNNVKFSMSRKKAENNLLDTEKLVLRKQFSTYTVHAVPEAGFIALWIAYFFLETSIDFNWNHFLFTLDGKNRSTAALLVILAKQKQLLIVFPNLADKLICDNIDLLKLFRRAKLRLQL